MKCEKERDEDRATTSFDVNRIRPFEANPVSRLRLSTSSILLITNEKDPLRCTQSRLRASHVTIVAISLRVLIRTIVAISHRVLIR